MQWLRTGTVQEGFGTVLAIDTEEIVQWGALLQGITDMPRLLNAPMSYVYKNQDCG